MTEAAALGLRVTSDGVEQATRGLKGMTRAAFEAERAALALAAAETAKRKAFLDALKANRDASKAQRDEAEAALKSARAAESAAQAKLKQAQATAQVERAGRTTAGSLQKMMGASDGVRGAFHRMALGTVGTSGALARMAGVLGTVTGRLVAMASAALSVGGYIRLADAWSDMQSKVGSAIKDMAAAPELMGRMVDLANASYSPLSQTVDVYARNVAVMRTLGYSSAQTADYTEALNHALVTTATKGDDAAVVLNSLSRALSAGKMDADAYDVIMSRSPRVMEAIADKAGVAVTSLRAMASQGKITGAMIAGGLLTSLEKLREEAGQMPATVADGITRIHTGLQALIGVFDQATGSSGALAGVLVGVGDALAHAARWMFENGDIAQTVFVTVIGTAVSYATILLAKYTIGLGLAAAATIRMALATGTLSGALGVLKGAILSTGIGAIAVLAGVLIGQFMKLSAAVGGWGEAFRLIGEVASEALNRIKMSFLSWSAGVDASWLRIKAGAVEMFAGIVSSGIEFGNLFIGVFRGAYAAVQSIWSGLPGMLGDFAWRAGTEMLKALTYFATQSILPLRGVLGLVNAAREMMGQEKIELGAVVEVSMGRNPYQGAAAAAGTAASDAFLAAFHDNTIEDPKGYFEGVAGGMRDQAAAYQEAAGMLGRAAAQPMTAWQRLKAAITGNREEVAAIKPEAVGAGKALAEVGKGGKQGADEARDALKKLREEIAKMPADLAESIAGWMTEGFKGGLSAMKDLLVKHLRDMAMIAARNRIVVQLGVAGGFSAAQVSAAQAAGGVGNSGLGMLGNIGGMFGSISAGFSSVFSALGTGGLSGAMGAIGSAVKGIGAAGSMLSGVGTAIGAVAAPLLAVAAVFSFFSKKTKELDRGLRVTVDGLSAYVEEFRTIQTTRFWGLSKKTRTHYETAEDETQAAIGRAVGHLQAGILNAAKILDVGASAFDGFSHVLSISTKDMTEDQALKAVQTAVGELGDAYAILVPGLKDQIQYSETATAALERLAGSLTGVRQMADLLGHSFTTAGMAGGILASHLAELFGGIDAMGQATQTYWMAVYTEEERLATMTRQATTALAALGVQMPQSRDEYRAMVEALDLSKDGSHALYAALVSMAGVMDQILPSVAGLTVALSALQGDVLSALNAVISAANDAARASASAAADWLKAAQSLRDWVDKMRGTVSPLTSPLQARAWNEAQYQTTLASAMAGDLAAVQGLTGAADRLLQSVNGTARTQAEAALAEARILADVGRVTTKVVDVEAARHDAIAKLLGEQVAGLEQIRDYIAAGNALSEEQIDDLLGRVGIIGSLIAGRGLSAPLNALHAPLGALLGPLDALRSPLTTLRGALDALRLGIEAEAVRRAAVPVFTPPAAPTPVAPTPAPVAAKPLYSAADYKVSVITGGNTDWWQVTGPLGGVRRMGEVGVDDPMVTLAQQGWPAFARGGSHKGGPAYIGENDLELVAPSRVYNPQETRAMLDNRQVVEEIRALRAENAELRSVVTSLGISTAENTRRMHRVLAKWDAVGTPVTGPGGAPVITKEVEA